MIGYCLIRDNQDKYFLSIGYLHKRIKHRWAKRWCSIKDEKFFVYKRNPKERPEDAILLNYAALSTPSDSDRHASGRRQFMFKLRFEGEMNVVLRVRREDDMERWIECLKVSS